MAKNNLGKRKPFWFYLNPDDTLAPQTLPVLTATCLKEAIASGRWGGILPSERALARELGVGRGVVRAALL